MAGQLLRDQPADGVLRADDLQPREARGARPRDPRRARRAGRRRAGAGARCIVLTGEGALVLLRATTSATSPTTSSPSRPSRSSPIRSRARSGARRHRHPDRLRDQRPGDRRRPRARARLRPARRRRRASQFGMPPAKLGLVYSHTGLRRFIDAIGAPRTRELFLVGRRISPDDGARLGPRQRRRRAGRRSRPPSLDWASELAGNAPLSVRGNKRVIRELLARRRATLDAETERELIALREACFASEDMLRGRARVRARSAPRAGRAGSGSGVRVCTWNVNSLRARLPRVLELLEKHAPDVVLLQETKVAPDQFPDAELRGRGLRRPSTTAAASGRASRSSRAPGSASTARRAGLAGRDPRRGGALDRGRRPGLGVRVASVYVVNGREVGSADVRREARIPRRDGDRARGRAARRAARSSAATSTSRPPTSTSTTPPRSRARRTSRRTSARACEAILARGRLVDAYRAACIPTNRSSPGGTTARATSTKDLGPAHRPAARVARRSPAVCAPAASTATSARARSPATTRRCSPSSDAP